MIPRAKTWTELLEQLFGDSWNSSLRRFPSPFAFRGLASHDHDLSNSLLRLAGAGADITRLELSLLRNFRKYGHDHTTSGVDSIWHWLPLAQHTACRRGSWTGPTRRSWRSTSPLSNQRTSGPMGSSGA